MRIGHLNTWLQVHFALVLISLAIIFLFQLVALFRFSMAIIFTGKETRLMSDSLTNLAWLIGAVFILGLLLIAILLLVSRWRKPVLFISYQNAHEAQADRLCRAFAALGHEVLKLGFDPKRAHDPTVSAVRNMVTKCDVVVAVPSETPSFMDTELARAETLGKGIIIARHLPEQRTIGAIQEGYPQIALHQLLANPAAGSAFLCWAMFYWRTAIEPLREGAKSGVTWFSMTLVYVGISLLFTLVLGTLIAVIVFVFSGSGAVFALIVGRWVELLTLIFLLPIAAFFARWQMVVGNQLETHSLVHQTFLSGQLTLKMLQDACESSNQMKVAVEALIPQNPVADEKAPTPPP